MRIASRAGATRRAGARHRRVSRIGVYAVLMCACATLLWPVSPAMASFTPAVLLSGTARQQFEEANGPELSRDGEYVAFQGSLAGLTGVWRRDLRSGAIEPVAVAYDKADPGFGAPSEALSAPDAAGASISGEGRYVAFTTTADLEPEHTGEHGEPEGEPATDKGCPEVYRRDMSIPAADPGAYTLVSALNGGGQGIVFSGGCATVNGGFAIAGAQAAPGVALSASGEEVAFTVLSPSDLFAYPGEPSRQTPSSQVAVRNLETETTTVMSVTPASGHDPEGEPAPGGGAFPSTLSEGVGSLRVSSGLLGEELTASTASISGDGNAVAWLGSDVPAQVPGSGPEIEAGVKAGAESGGWEAEPLWRAIGDGPGAEVGGTRRLLAGAGLDFFYNRGETGEVVRGGSFVTTGGYPLFIAPVLSENGETAGVIADAPPSEALGGVALGGIFPPQTDAYAIRVGAGEAISLTQTPDYDIPSGAPNAGYVTNISISPDGERLAFDSDRETMTLSPLLSQITPPASGSQVYLANLTLGTLQDASVTWNGEPPSGPGDGAMGLLSLDQEHKLAFGSSATGLFYGDALKAPEIYLTEELPAEQPPGEQSESAIPPTAPPVFEWRLDATATAQPDGSVLVYAQAPAAGKLTATATAQLSAPAPHKTKPKTKPKIERKAKAHKAGSDERVSPYTVAGGTVAASTAAPVRLRLSAKAAYRPLVASRDGLYTVLRLTFTTTTAHTPLIVEIPVTFHRTEKAKTKTKTKAKTRARKQRAADKAERARR